MKANCKKIFIVSVIVVLIVVILAPLLIKAENRAGAKGFCERLSSVVSRIEQRLTNYTNRLQERRNEIKNRVSERRGERENKLEEKRGKWDANRSEHFNALEERAGTDAQKIAVANFKSKIFQAIIERRAAVDKTINDFRTGVDNLKFNRKSSIDDLIIAYKKDIKAVLDQALAVCESGSNPSVIISGLREELKRIKNDFVVSRQETDNISEEMKALIVVKKEAVKRAIDDFKGKLNQALTELKSQFPEIEEEAEEPDEND